MNLCHGPGCRREQVVPYWCSELCEQRWNGRWGKSLPDDWWTSLSAAFPGGGRYAAGGYIAPHPGVTLDDLADMRAKLVYGYEFGGDEDGWAVAEAGEYGEWKPEWLTNDGDEDEDDLIADAENVLLASVGFTETDWEADGYFDRKRAAEARLEVQFIPHGGDYACWALVCHEITVEWGEAAEVDLPSLTAAVGEGGWDAKLAAALAALGATPKQARPAWLLLAFWG